MKLKRVVTLFTAIVAVGTALAGTAGARNLLVGQGWHIVNPDGEDQNVGETPPTGQCPDETQDTCAYYMNADGSIDQNRKLTFPL